MTAAGWLQIALFCAAVLAVTKPLGRYLFRVFEQEPPLPRLDRFVLRLCGVQAQEQTWGAAHGGEMGLESTPGQGSRFWFTLPVPGGR